MNAISVTGAVIAGLLCSNIWLWINLYNLKQTHFEFEHLIFKLLKELCEQPAQDSASESTQKPANKV